MTGRSSETEPWSLDFLQALVNFPKEAINDETVELLKVGGLLITAAGFGAVPKRFRMGQGLHVNRWILSHRTPAAALLCRPRLQLRLRQEGLRQRRRALQLGRGDVQVPHRGKGGRQGAGRPRVFRLSAYARPNRHVPAILSYIQVVEPKIAALRGAEAELRVATREREAVEGELAAVQGRLDEMQAHFDAAMVQKKALQDDAGATQRKMDAAEALISALAGEEVRWTAQSRAFDDTISRLAGDCAVASRYYYCLASVTMRQAWHALTDSPRMKFSPTAPCSPRSFVSYLGPFNKEFRELLLARDFYATCVRLGIPVTENLQVRSLAISHSQLPSPLF